MKCAEEFNKSMFASLSYMSVEAQPEFISLKHVNEDTNFKVLQPLISVYVITNIYCRYHLHILLIYHVHLQLMLIIIHFQIG
jgi:hypothetical protein